MSAKQDVADVEDISPKPSFGEDTPAPATPTVEIPVEVAQYCYRQTASVSPRRLDFPDMEQYVQAQQNNITTLVALETALQAVLPQEPEPEAA